MELSGDDIAGVVDLFGALTREELAEALAELAFKAGEEYETDRFVDDIEKAVESYHLVRVESETVDVSADTPLLVAGPGSFPTLPDNATDLVHILDVEERQVDRATAGLSVLDRFREDAAGAVDAADADRVDHLIDVSYELEAWADVDLRAEREHLDRTA